MVLSLNKYSLGDWLSMAVLLGHMSYNVVFAFSAWIPLFITCGCITLFYYITIVSNLVVYIVYIIQKCISTGVLN